LWIEKVELCAGVQWSRFEKGDLALLTRLLVGLLVFLLGSMCSHETERVQAERETTTPTRSVGIENPHESCAVLGFLAKAYYCPRSVEC
jgi:hypothetical protein